MKCPVCGNECFDYQECSNCGFDQLDKSFINKEEAALWEQQVVAPCRKIYNKLTRKIVVQRQEYRKVDTDPLKPAISQNQDNDESPNIYQTEKHLAEKGNNCDFTINCITSSTAEISTFVGFDDIKTVIIPERIDGLLVTRIADNAFENCKSITNVELPKTIVTIGKKAFQGSGIEQINFPEGLEVIGESSFEYTKLKRISIPSTVKCIDCCAFANTPLQIVAISRGVSIIESYAFSSCIELNEIDIPTSVTSIGQWAFFAPKRVDFLIRIPDSVVSIGKDVTSVYSKLRGECDDSELFTDRYSTLGVTIYCNAGSHAMAYARKHGIKIKRYEEYDDDIAKRLERD